MNNLKTSAEAATAFAQLGERETAVRSRLREIEAAASPGQLGGTAESYLRLVREADLLHTELRQIASQVQPLLDLQQTLEKHEAAALVPALLKQVENKVTQAEKARAAWDQAREGLTRHLGEIGHRRTLARAVEVQTETVSVETFDRAAMVLNWLPPHGIANPSDHHHRAMMTRLAMQRQTLLDESPDAATVNAWAAGGVESGLQLGLPAKAPRRDGGYLSRPRIPPA